MDRPHASEPTLPVDAPRAVAPTVVAETVAGAAPVGVHRLGPYVLVRLIAQGGMGSVWEAMDSRLGRRVAVKMMLRDGGQAGERFQREALHAAKLHHPNIVAVHDVGSDRGRAYLVMDLIEGPTLEEALRERPTTWREKADIVEVIARAVHYAHQQGVVHRDLKPANVLLKRAPEGTRALRRGSSGEISARALGEPLVMDFGLAKDVAEESALSRDGQAMGTPAYMPPEQAEGRLDRIGPRSDVYGLGAILYETLTGRAPFAGETPARIMRAVVEDEPATPGSVVVGVPRDLETICLRCLEKQPARRYASAAAVADDLAAWLAGDPIAARRASWLEHAVKRVRKNPAAWTAAALAALIFASAIAGALAFLEVRRSEAVAHTAELERQIALWRDEQARREAAEAERARLERERSREWQLVFSDRFDRDDLAERWDVISVGGTAEVRGGELHLTGGRPQIASPRGRFVGDARIAFTCRAASRVASDVSCFLAASGFADARADKLDGYICQFGGRGNTVLALLRDNDPVLVSRHDGAIVADHAYRVVADRVGGHITYDVDGQRVLDWTDPHPFGDGRDRLGIYSYDTDFWVDDVEVYRLGEPRSADILDVVERHVDLRQPIDGERLIDDVVASTRDADRLARAQRARAKIESHRRQDADYERVKAAVLAHWPGGRTTLSSDGEVAVDLEGEAPSDLAPLEGLPIQRLSLGAGDVEDLAPLAGMPLSELDIGANRVASLAALAGMRLRALHADRCRIVDLAPLAGQPLELLDVSVNRIADLAPLAGMPLRELFVQRNLVRDLAPLAGMPLTRLICGANPIRSLAPIARLPLISLDISGIPGIDLAPLAGMPLGTLGIDDDGVESLAPLAGMRLSDLSCHGNRIADLAPLAGEALNVLDIGDNPIASLAPLAGMPLMHLEIRDLPAIDLTPIAGLSLDTFSCSRTPIADLALVARMPLRHLTCDGTAIADLAPLAGKRLATLEIAGTRVSDLAPLAGMPLEWLRCDGAPIASLEPLRGDDVLVYVSIDDTRVRDVSPVAHQRLAMLHAVGAPIADLAPLAAAGPGQLIVDRDVAGADAFVGIWRRLVAEAGDKGRYAWTSLDPRAGRTRERELAGRRYLLLPMRLTLPEARAAARAAGARLARARPGVDAMLDDLVGSDGAWVDAALVAGAPTWGDGSPAPELPAATANGRPAYGYCSLGGDGRRSIEAFSPIDAERMAMRVLLERDP